MEKEKGGAGYEASTCFMAQDVSEKHQPQIRLPLGQIDISVACNVSEMYGHILATE